MEPEICIFLNGLGEQEFIKNTLFPYSTHVLYAPPPQHCTKRLLRREMPEVMRIVDLGRQMRRYKRDNMYSVKEACPSKNDYP